MGAHPLDIYTALLALWSRRRSSAGAGVDPYLPYALGTVLCVNIFFLLLISWPANPFRALSPIPPDGPGPNALLQNSPFMGVHPPLLYTGYVGMSVPFALATGALLAGRLNPDWPKVIRRWTMIPWTFLSLGIVAGAWWSYEVLGWGGYWAWDPVENASFMPWLTATAFLHSVMVQERRGMLKTWTITLIVSTFLLTVLGTFLTRSGVLASVHAFTQSPIGPFFLTFLGLVLLGSLTLLAWRSDALSSEGRFDAALSRESAFMVNNLLFASFAFVVLLGTMFPLIAEAARGVKVSVGGPYFSQMSVPIALLLIFLAGVGPALPWRKGSLELLRGKFRWPTIVAVATGIVLAVSGVRAPARVAGLRAGGVLRRAPGGRVRRPDERPPSGDRGVVDRRAVARLRQQPPAVRRLHRARGHSGPRGRRRLVLHVPARAGVDARVRRGRAVRALPGAPRLRVGRS